MTAVAIKPRIAAIIPARGGSKGLRRKNIRLLMGKPLIAYSISAALEARSVDDVYVSTEDPEIAATARQLGATVIDRPASLATDAAQNDAVMLHAIETLERQARRPEIVVLLQPTSPLRSARHLDECLGGFYGSGAKSAISICAVDHHPGKSVLLQEGFVEPFTNDTDMEARRQDMVPAYRQNGAIYVVRTDDFLRHRKFYLKPSLGYIMDRRLSIDVDDEFDLQLAEAIIADRLGKES